MTLVFFVLCFASLTSCSKAEWTKQEVIDWYSRYGAHARGGLLYQGTDTKTHHFAARVMDDWVFIQIKKTDLKLDEEHPYAKASSSLSSYYAVDPGKGFARIESKNQTQP